MCIKIIGKYRYFRLNLTMPYYAVAVGRCVGIYDTYSECQKQVLQYPGAKFKKFDSVVGAQEFISKYSVSCTPGNSIAMQLDFPNNNPKSLPQDSEEKGIQKEVSLHDILDRLTRFEEKFNQFVFKTTSMLDDFKTRLVNIETSCLGGSRSIPSKSSKRIKLEESGINVDESLFIRNHDGVVIVYTDGACVKNGATGARAGIGIWFNHNHPLNVSAPLRGPATNNNAEIQAARVALNQAAKAGIKKLCVHTDSKFLISCITEWIHKWKKNNWKLVSGEDVKNRVELEKLDLALQQLESVEWEHVRGHRGNEGNEMADKLARDGAALYQINITYSDYSDV